MAAMNYWAIPVAMAAAVVAGMIWYPDAIFGRAWKRLQGLSEPVKTTLWAVIIWVVASFAMAYTLHRIVLLRMGIYSMGEALLVGLLISVGVVLACAAPDYAYAKKPLALFAIDEGYVVLPVFIMIAVMTAWD